HAAEPPGESAERCPERRISPELLDAAGEVERLQRRARRIGRRGGDGRAGGAPRGAPPADDRTAGGFYGPPEAGAVSRCTAGDGGGEAAPRLGGRRGARLRHPCHRGAPG